jgi:NAD(P)-dependent dehydrogenase (short-subunit alcohol dehydrogenase family)
MNKTFLVSGAGTGIGQAICTQLQASAPDASLVLVGRNIDRLERTKKLLGSAAEHFVVSADTRDGAALGKEFARIGLEKRNLYGIVANAGVGGGNEYGPDDRWDEVMDTNLKGAYILFNEALPALKSSGHEYRHLIVVSSILARMGVPGYSAYCASKAGLLGLTRSLAIEHARSKILVNAICPGWVDTDMATSGIDAMAKTTGRPYDEILKREMRQVPLGKMSQPEEIGSLAAYLMSDSQRSITGQGIDINGGALMP